MPELLLHGTPRLRWPDGRTLVLSAREAALLAWLHLEGPSPRARLAGWLWPGGDDAKARANLRQTLARLRRAAGNLLAEHEGRLALAAGLQVADAQGAPLLANLAFDDAPELAQWLAARREAEQRAQLRSGLAEGQAHLAQGELDAALAAADTVLAQHPESEEAWRLRMAVFHQRGDRAQALQAWDDCRHALRAAFGVGPSAETQVLGERLLAGATVPLAASGLLPPALRRPPRLVGREAALATLLPALQLGHGAQVLGPGGIGKSRLLEELAAHFEPALCVSARPGDAVQPGALVARLAAAALRRFAPALDAATQADVNRLLPPPPGAPAPDELGSAIEHRRVLAALARAIEACQARGLRLLLLDDLHFADDASLDALGPLAGGWLAAPPDTALRLLFGARPDELSPAAQGLLARLAQSGRVARCELPPLSPAQLRHLLDDLALPAAATQHLDALAEALRAQFGGNPGFVLESLKSLCLDLAGGRGAPAGAAGAAPAWQPAQPLPRPPTLLESVRRRLDRLSAEALQIAQLAAVAQADFRPELAATALGRSTLALAPVLAELESAQVFDGQGFCHDLVAEAVQHSLPATLAGALHRWVAEQLTAQQGPAARIAHHLVRSGNPRAAADWQLRAAEQARGQWQMPAAAEAFEAAAAALDPVADRARVFGAWREAARCWLAASRYDAAGRALDAAEPLARGAREATLVRATRSTQLFNTERHVEAAACARHLADALLDDTQALTPDEIGQILLSCALASPYSDAPERVLAACEAMRTRAVDPSSAHPAPSTAARLGIRIDFSQGYALNWLARPLEALPLLARGWQAAIEHELRTECVNLGNQLIRGEELRGRLPEALQWCERTRQAMADASVGAGFLADLLNYRGLLRVAAGQPWAGLASLDEADAQLGAGVAPGGYHTSRKALAWLLAGRVEAAAALPQPAAPRPGSPLAMNLLWLQLWRDQALGRPLGPALACCAAAPLRPGGLLWWRQQVLQARWGPPAAPALPALQDLIAGLQARGLLSLLRSAHSAAADAALAAGQPQQALAQTRAALALAAHADPWCEPPAQVWLDAARVLAACGAEAEAQAAWQAGRAWVMAAAEGAPDAAAHAAWCHGHPTHRALCAGPTRAVAR